MFQRRASPKLRNSKQIPVGLTAACIGGVTVLCVCGMALIVASKQRIPSEFVSAESAKEIAAKANLQEVRKAYLEKLSRTDYNLGVLRNATYGGQSNQVGWRQESAAGWAQEIRQSLQSEIDNPHNIKMYRMNMIPALQLTLLKTYQEMTEASSGNTRYILKTLRSDGSTEEQSLSRAAFINLSLNKFEAIDLATNLDSNPRFNPSQMLSQLRNVQQEYLVRLGAVLEAQGYEDPLDQLNNINTILDSVNREETNKRLKKMEPVLTDKPFSGKQKTNRGGGKD
ncbi:MAG: hypothetical protein KME64_41505 [Scytonematopsis contorta HA4267-MV1]|jgi:hypothetical protein|nr:hypothetical protein [Scytonematopsis contorta HA4267-MV1]